MKSTHAGFVIRHSSVLVIALLVLMAACGPGSIDDPVQDIFLQAQSGGTEFLLVRGGSCKENEVPDYCRTGFSRWIPYCQQVESTCIPIESLQERLAAWGYLDGSAFETWQEYGTFGPVTEVAVSAFQAWNRVWPEDTVEERRFFSNHTGKVDKLTWNLLQQEPVVTTSKRVKYPNGVSLNHLTPTQLVSYFLHEYDRNNPTNVPLNQDPGGVNFVQIRGFDVADMVPIQNVNKVSIDRFDGFGVNRVDNEFNDPIFVLVNPDDCRSGECSPDPKRLVVLKASADYGQQFTLITYGFGCERPGWMTQSEHPVLGEKPKISSDGTWLGGINSCFQPGTDCYPNKGLIITAANRVTSYMLGHHKLLKPDTTIKDFGIALLDPRFELPGENAAKRQLAYVDFNHNYSIDGLEWDYPVGLEQTEIEGKQAWDPVSGKPVNYTGMQKSRMSAEVHIGNDSELVGDFSAGCHTVPTNGEYQKLTKILLESGQVRTWVEQLYKGCWEKIDPGQCFSMAMETVRGSRRTSEIGGGKIDYINSAVDYIDKKLEADNPYTGTVFMGYEFFNSSIRFPLLLLDSRDLSDPDFILGN